MTRDGGRSPLIQGERRAATHCGLGRPRFAQTDCRDRRDARRVRGRAWTRAHGCAAVDGLALCRFGARACRRSYRPAAHLRGHTTGFERLGTSISGRYQIGDTLSLFGDLIFSSVEGKKRFAPKPVQSSSFLETTFGYPLVPAYHPDNPWDWDVELLYRTLDMGNRVHVNDSDSLRALLGLDGAWNLWDWRVSAMYSENDVERVRANHVDLERFQQALLGTGGPSGDQWYNPFGANPQNDPALLDWLREQSS